MISKERFSNLNEGDVLIMKVGNTGLNRPRKIIQGVQNNCVRLKKVSGVGDTVYNYSDIYKNVIGVVTIKLKQNGGN